jgi:hypothetical protein
MAGVCSGKGLSDVDMIVASRRPKPKILRNCLKALSLFPSEEVASLFSDVHDLDVSWASSS